MYSKVIQLLFIYICGGGGGGVLPRWLSGKESTCQCRRHRRLKFYPWVGKMPWRRAWQPTSVFLPGKSHGQRSLAGYSPWGRKEMDMTCDWAHTHTRVYVYTRVYIYMYIHTHIYNWTYTQCIYIVLFQVLLHYKLLQDIDYSCSL